MLKLKVLILVGLFFVVMLKATGHGFSGYRTFVKVYAGDISTGNSNYDELIKWCKESNHTMFVIPPMLDIFFSFRFLSKKSIWISEHDVNQLAYSADHYSMAYARLRALGMVMLAPHRRSYSYNPCYLGTRPEFETLPIIFEREGFIGCEQQYSVLFENEDYVAVIRK